MEAHLSRDDECDWLDGVRGEFVRARDLAFGHADSAPWDEAHPTLRVARLFPMSMVTMFGSAYSRSSSIHVLMLLKVDSLVTSNTKKTPTAPR
jgi:hypothetical protein